MTDCHWMMNNCHKKITSSLVWQALRSSSSVSGLLILSPSKTVSVYNEPVLLLMNQCCCFFFLKTSMPNYETRTKPALASLATLMKFSLEIGCQFRVIHKKANKRKTVWLLPLSMLWTSSSNRNIQTSAQLTMYTWQKGSSFVCFRS